MCISGTTWWLPWDIEKEEYYENVCLVAGDGQNIESW